VLLRADRERAHTAEYLRLALQTQEEDGFWPIPNSTAEGAVLATLYGAELLYLGRKHPDLPRAALREVERKWIRAMEWLIRSRRPDGLWSTGMLKDQPWEGAVASAWVLHRLLSPPPKLSERWRRCVEDAAEQMIRLVDRPETWLRTSPAQRFRIEARVAGALRRAASAGGWSKRMAKSANRYITAWERRDGARLGGLKDDEIDVSTAAFALWVWQMPNRSSTLAARYLPRRAIGLLRFKHGPLLALTHGAIIRDAGTKVPPDGLVKLPNAQRFIYWK